MAKMARLESDQIVRRLSDMGIDVKLETYRDFAQGEMSAWNIARRWLQSMASPPKDSDEDFICFAACELWKSYIPERPSMEMVDDWVQEGYDLEEAGKLEEAFGIWQRVWSRVLDLLTPEMRTLSSVEPVFHISHFFLNWIQDYEMCLDNLIADDDSWLKTGIPFLEKVLLQFPEEKDVLYFHCDLGRWLIQDGRVQEGVAMLEGIISSQPERADGYVALLNAQNQFREAYLETKDAIEVLMRAKAVCPQEELEAWDIEARLAELIEEGQS